MVQSKPKEIRIRSLLHQDLIFQHYQPIVELSTNQLYSYESLLRSKLQYTPDVLLRLARQQDQLYVMDTMCIFNSIQTFFKPEGSRETDSLFINVFPSTLLETSFMPLLDWMMDQANIPPSRIVFELNEAKDEDEIWEMAAFHKAVSMLRKKGFRIAMDDIGDGAADLKKIVEFMPDYIKMSRYFSKGLATTEKKQRILQLFLEYFGADTKMILEGIENQNDLVCAKNLGVALGQGYLLGKPKEL